MSLKKLKLTKKPHIKSGVRYPKTWVGEFDSIPKCLVCKEEIKNEFCYVSPTDKTIKCGSCYEFTDSYYVKIEMI